MKIFLFLINEADEVYYKRVCGVMFDCHCDLLTYIYVNRNNINKIKKQIDVIYNKNNITGGIFNLYFMSPKEMKEELNIENINLIEMFEKSISIIDKYNLLPNIKKIYGIEGLDYLENISDIDTLYDLGLRSTNIVWNNKNKFGSGIRENGGLTKLGERLIDKLVQKRIAIDLSHANENTFFDITKRCKLLKKVGYDPIVFASHSNVKSICNVERNLSNKQIKEILDFDGIIGIVEYKKFVSESNDYETNYIKHIRYIKSLKGDISNIAVSTDDEVFFNIEKRNKNMYEITKVKDELEKLLKNNNLDYKGILYNNVFQKVCCKLE